MVEVASVLGAFLLRLTWPRLVWSTGLLQHIEPRAAAAGAGCQITKELTDYELPK